MHHSCMYTITDYFDSTYAQTHKKKIRPEAVYNRSRSARSKAPSSPYAVLPRITQHARAEDEV